MKKVICNGSVVDSVAHQCAKRKCPHRILHKPVKERCGIKNHNGNDGWCVFPGTVSPLDGYEDGSLVTCMPESEIRKEELALNKSILEELEEQRKKLVKAIDKNQSEVKTICNRIRILKNKYQLHDENSMH